MGGGKWGVVMRQDVIYKDSMLHSFLLDGHDKEDSMGGVFFAILPVGTIGNNSLKGSGEHRLEQLNVNNDFWRGVSFLRQSRSASEIPETKLDAFKRCMAPKPGSDSA